MPLKDFLGNTSPEERTARQAEAEEMFKKDVPQWAWRVREEGIALVNQATAPGPPLDSNQKLRLLEEARQKFLKARAADLLLPTANMVAVELAEGHHQFESALALFEANIRLASDLGMTEDVIDTLCLMAHCHIHAGDRDKAQQAFGEARSLAATTTDRRLIEEVEYDAQALDRDFLIDVHRGTITKVPRRKESDQGKK